MAQVVLTVNANSYTMQCNDGEEDHLRELGQVLDAEVSKIKSAVGQVGDIRLLLMSGLVIADRLSETLQRVEELEDQVQGLRQSKAEAVQQAEQHAAAKAAEQASRQVEKQGDKLSEDMSGRLDAAADRIEALAREIA